MIYIKVKKMFKIIILSLLVLIVGCSDSKKEKKNTQEITPKSSIKVTTNAVDTKVKSKEVKNKDGGQFYYALDKKKKEKDYNSEDSKTRTTIDAYLHIKSPYERVRITMMIKRLSRDYVIKCSPCHDDYANGVIGPSLLDKDGEFIYQRIMDFKSGKKKNILMKELVEQIDDEKLKSIAEEIATFNKQIQKMRGK